MYHGPMHYLDWAATAPPYRDILEAAVGVATERYGNPSSRHGAGRDARALLESARERLGAAIGAAPSSVVFTSGGSEADAIALLSTLVGKGERSVVISELEHPAVYEQARALESLGVRVVRVRPERDGVVSPGRVAEALRPDTAVVAVMAVSNETGAIQPIGRIVEAVRSAAGPRRPYVHCDAVQALGTIGFDARALGVDGAAFSAHKLGGPRGVGALYLSRPISPLVLGGGQEGGMRPGTHNTAGAWAFAEAAARAAASVEARMERARALERRLFDGLRAIPGATPLPEGRLPGDERYSPYIACLSFPGLAGETMTRLLDEAGVAISTGSACSSSKKERRSLDAMGVDRELSFSSIRVSSGRDTSEADIDAFLEAASSAYIRFRV